jgi:23S rRNA (guanosine2251-2'-O)-methyltransferase
MSDTAFGYHAVESLIRKEPRRVTALHVQADRQDRRMQALCELSRNQGVSVLSCSKSELDALVAGRHQGVVAVLDPAVGAESAGMMSEADLGEHLSQVAAPLILILDGVTDPHNLGACLRSADAAGATAVIFPKDKSADVNEVARKVASGAAETVPWVRVTNLARTIELLKQTGVWVIGTDGDAETVLYEQDLSGPCALVLGSEGAGMRRLTRDLCDFVVKLPMAGSVSSLNVSVAAGVCLFEAVRQRSANKA